MHTRTLAIKDFDSFQIVFETDDYALVFKPPNIPTAPLHENEPDTLLARFFEERPQAKNNRSRFNSSFGHAYFWSRYHREKTSGI